MAFRLAKGSLFAVLLRSSWWISACIGLFFIAMGLVIAEAKFLVVGILGSLPFFGIAGYAAYKESKRPSPQRIMEVVTEARKMRTAQIAAKISARYQEKRFDSEAFKGSAADLLLSRGHERLVLCSKRFKVANTGIDPLKQLVSAGEAVEATGYLYVALGEVSDAAFEYANQNHIELIRAAELAAFFDGQVEID